MSPSVFGCFWGLCELPNRCRGWGRSPLRSKCHWGAESCKDSWASAEIVAPQSHRGLLALVLASGLMGRWGCTWLYYVMLRVVESEFTCKTNSALWRFPARLRKVERLSGDCWRVPNHIPKPYQTKPNRTNQELEPTEETQPMLKCS